MAILLAVGCNKKNDIKSPSSIKELVHKIFTVGSSEQATSELRTTVDRKNRIIWEENDALYVCSQDWTPALKSGDGLFKLKEGAGTTMGIFEGNAVPSDIYYCAYPAVKESDKAAGFYTSSQIENGTLYVINKIYGSRESADMSDSKSKLHGVGVSDNSNHFTFKHLTGLLKVMLKTTSTTEAVSMIAIQDLDGKQLFGKYKVNPADGDVSIEFFDEEEKDNTVMTMDLGEGIEVSSDEFKEFDFTLPANVFDNGLRLTVTAANGEVRSIDIPKAPVKCGGITTVKREVDLKKPECSIVTVSSNNEEMGTVDKSEIQLYASSEESIKATANSTYRFDHWELNGSPILVDGYTLNSNPIKIKSDGTDNVGSVVAYFASPTTVSVVGTTGGTVNVSSVSIYPDSKQKVVATAYSGYRFHYWGLDGAVGICDGYTEQSNPTYIKGVGSAGTGTITAYFLLAAKITISAGEGGSVSPTTIDKLYSDTQKQITATPNKGYKFSNWTFGGSTILISGSTSDNSVYIKSDGNSKTGTALATFELVNTTVVASSSDINKGTVNVTTPFNVNIKSSYDLTATPKDGYEFDYWEYGSSIEFVSGSESTASVSIKSNGSGESDSMVAHFKDKSSPSDIIGEVLPNGDVKIDNRIWMNTDLSTTNTNLTNKPNSPYDPYYYIMDNGAYKYSFNAACNVLAKTSDGSDRAKNVKNAAEITKQSLCPDGYRLPTIDEWSTLIEAINGKKTYLSFSQTGYYKRSNGKVYGEQSNNLYITATGITTETMGQSGDATGNIMNVVEIIKTAESTYTLTKSKEYKTSAFSVRCIKK